MVTSICCRRVYGFSYLRVADVTYVDAQIETLLFDEKTPLGSKKLMTFHRNDDFSFSVTYKDGTALAKVNISGIADALKKQEADSGSAVVSAPKVKVVMELSDSGIFSVVKAYALFTKKPVETKENAGNSIKDKVMNFLSGKKEAKPDSVGLWRVLVLVWYLCPLFHSLCRILNLVMVAMTLLMLLMIPRPTQQRLLERKEKHPPNLDHLPPIRPTPLMLSPQRRLLQLPRNH